MPAAAFLAVLAGCSENVAGGAAAVAVTTGTSSPATSSRSQPTTVAATVTVTKTVASSSRELAKTTAAATTSTKKWRLPNPKAKSPTNAFGDIKAVPGQAYGLFFSSKSSGTDNGAVVFVVTRVTLDPTCKAGTPKPPHGHHFLKLDLEVEPREMTRQSLDDWAGSFNSSSWTAFAADGTAEVRGEDSSADECATDPLPEVTKTVLANAPLLEGSVVLDVVAAKGTIVLDLGIENGWEYGYS
ncbi:MAG: hypothetical protein M3Z00_01490 [Actinomycetota bacterium]|nr:hypothetical protein [Actinomycetota bacterium]